MNKRKFGFTVRDKKLTNIISSKFTNNYTNIILYGRLTTKDIPHKK